MNVRRSLPYWCVDARPCLWEDGKLPLVLSAEGTTWQRRYDLEYLQVNARPVSEARFRAMVDRAATAGARVPVSKAARSKPVRKNQQTPTNRRTRKSSGR